MTKLLQDGQTVSDLIQRLVCKHGDESGSRTWRRKDSAVDKVEHFRARVYQLVMDSESA